MRTWRQGLKGDGGFQKFLWPEPDLVNPLRLTMGVELDAAHRSELALLPTREEEGSRAGDKQVLRAIRPRGPIEHVSG